MKNPVRWNAVWLVIVWFAAAGQVDAGKPAAEKAGKKIPWNMAALRAAPDFQWLDQTGSVHALAYEGLAYRGKPTRVFAYYASPRTLGKKIPNGGVPGLVLVHGGGGAAFARWAELWARRGYAAIAMDLAGCGEGRKRLPDGGPDQSGKTKFEAIDQPITDQWTYHAVADVVLAHSLLLSFNDVDVKRTGVTGISWGGYLTCIVAGVDQRLKVAMPVYGCGFLHENSVWLPQFKRMTPEQRNKWVSHWDPSRYIGAATMPVVFFNGTNDFAYPMDSYAKTCGEVRGEKNFCIRVRMPHGHIFDFPEFFLAIDQYLKGGVPLPIIAKPTVANGQVTAVVQSPVPLVSARLHFTTGPHDKNPSRPWTTKPMTVQGDRIMGPGPPADATVWYLDVTDKRGALVSTAPIVAK